MKKRIFFIISGIVIIFCFILSIILFYSIPRIKYSFDSKRDCYYVEKVYGYKESYEIKGIYNNYEVKYISDKAFYNKNNIKEIILPKEIIEINRQAFSNCRNLTKINLENVEIIHKNAFAYCLMLDNVNLNCTDLGASAFYHCDSLNVINLGNKIETIGSMSLSETNIERITIPSSVKMLGKNAFIYCDRLSIIEVYGNKLKNNEYLNSLNIVKFMEE